VFVCADTVESLGRAFSGSLTPRDIGLSARSGKGSLTNFAAVFNFPEAPQHARPSPFLEATAAEPGGATQPQASPRSSASPAQPIAIPGGQARWGDSNGRHVSAGVEPAGPGISSPLKM
jgi:hypothetical protein